MYHRVLRNAVIVCPSYTDVLQEVTKVGADSCVVVMIALSSVLGVALNSLYPAGLSELSSAFSTIISGRNDCGTRSMSILWSTLDEVPVNGPFVPLYARRRTRSHPTQSSIVSSDVHATCKFSHSNVSTPLEDCDQSAASDAVASDCDQPICSQPHDADPTVGVEPEASQRCHQTIARQRHFTADAVYIQ